MCASLRPEVAPCIEVPIGHSCRIVGVLFCFYYVVFVFAASKIARAVARLGLFVETVEPVFQHVLRQYMAGAANELLQESHLAPRQHDVRAIDANLARDADNLWLWRHPSSRLESQGVRDALLALADRLRDDVPDRAQIGLALGVVGVEGRTEPVVTMRFTEVDELVGGLGEVLDYADRRQMTIGFEPEPGMFVDTMTGFAELLAALDHRRRTGEGQHIDLAQLEAAGGHVEAGGPHTETQVEAELRVVLNDPVVNQCNIARAVNVGVGVMFTRRTVRGPAGVANP